MPIQVSMKKNYIIRQGEALRAPYDGGVRAICLIGHDECAMVGVAARRDAFVDGLVENGGWSPRDARNHFRAHAPHLDVGDPVGFLRSEAVRLSRRYPRVVFAPLYYSVGERLLYQIKW